MKRRLHSLVLATVFLVTISHAQAQQAAIVHRVEMLITGTA
jgi:hypothetical protein